MKILITGARSIEAKDWVYYHLDKVLMPLEEQGACFSICSGGQKGVDKIVEEYCRDSDIDFWLFKPYHMIDTKAEFVTRYFFTRNKQMVDNADLVIAFWDGKDTSTEDVIRYASKREKDKVIIPWNPEEAAQIEVVEEDV